MILIISFVFHLPFPFILVIWEFLVCLSFM
uniref:Uncharacterized protein n=1 Tax=Arundo donax TaxID=35708 RepID=A0A0A9B8V7_ARUDO